MNGDAVAKTGASTLYTMSAERKNKAKIEAGLTGARYTNLNPPSPIEKALSALVTVVALGYAV